jgi:PAS domain S-box-containing protein
MIFEAGASDYLTFPFGERETISKIDTYLKLKFIENKLINKNEVKYYEGEKAEKLIKKLNLVKDSEIELQRELNKYKSDYDEIKKINKSLVIENNKLEDMANNGSRQIQEITSELKEFNLMLEEEIAERNRTEEALKESERQFRYALEEAPLPIMLYIETGEVKKINSTWTDFTGYTIEDISSISKWADKSEAFSEDLNSADTDKLFNLQRRQNDGEYYIKTKEGLTRVWNFYSAYIGKLQDGHKLFMRVAIDITERKHMEELEKRVEEERKQLYEIKEYDRIKTEFFSNISHELRTPLNVIFSALQMHEFKLRDCSLQDSNFYKYTKIMKQNCYRLLRLVNNIIDITKIDSGYFDMNETNIDIINLVENITLSVADYIENKGVSLIFDTLIEEKNITCDPEKIERIILNLLSNAVKFTPVGGTITVNMEECNESICIRIKDTGRGIPAAKKDSIFKRFVQVDKSLTRECEGSGIGLSLVKCLVELHDGTISVESKLGKGTEFIINIPCRLSEELWEDNICSESIGQNLIERINLEFSDIYK